MAFPLFHYPQGTEPPFTIVVEHQKQTQNGSWTPFSCVRFSKTLRTSGFLGALPPEELRDFVWLLTFVSPSGVCAPTLPELAQALHISHAKARARLQKLLKIRWHGHPLVLCNGSESGLETFSLAPGLLPLQEEEACKEDEAHKPASEVALVHEEATRDYSRRTYARPRIEVEQEIARINNWTLPGDAESPQPEAKPGSALIQDLLAVGVLREQAEELVARFDEVRIRRQLMWLPYRSVRRPAGFLLAAIKDNYAAPPGLSQPTSAPKDPQETPTDG
jgi:hypothetical protein